MKLLFVTDLHGSEAVFVKSLRLFRVTKADFLLLGGDLAGKYIAPLVKEGDGWHIRDEAQMRVLHTPVERESYEKRISSIGGYPLECSEEELERLRTDEGFRESALKGARIDRLSKWLKIAEREIGGKLLVNLGNDDPFYLDEVVELGTGRPVLEYSDVVLDCGFHLVSCGYANRTPWNCPRDIDERQLESKLVQKLSVYADPSRVIGNFHCPPVHTKLDKAPRLDFQLRPIIGVDGVELASVGSTAVRRAIEKFGPALTLHGHVHEAYAKDRINATLCLNPGSAYHSGELRAALVHLDDGQIRGVQLIRES